MDEPNEDYRFAFIPVAAFVLIAGGACGLIAIFGLEGLQFDPNALACGAVAGTIPGLGLVALAVICFPVRIGPKAIRSYNFWGVYSTVAWADITSVGRFNLLGLRFVTIQHPAGARLYVPLFLADFPRFRARVLEWAGPENVFAQALQGIGRPSITGQSK